MQQPQLLNSSCPASATWELRIGKKNMLLMAVSISGSRKNLMLDPAWQWDPNPKTQTWIHFRRLWKCRLDELYLQIKAILFSLARPYECIPGILICQDSEKPIWMKSRKFYPALLSLNQFQDLDISRQPSWAILTVKMVRGEEQHTMVSELE